MGEILSIGMKVCINIFMLILFVYMKFNFLERLTGKKNKDVVHPDANDLHMSPEDKHKREQQKERHLKKQIIKDLLPEFARDIQGVFDGTVDLDKYNSQIVYLPEGYKDTDQFNFCFGAGANRIIEIPLINPLDENDEIIMRMTLKIDPAKKAKPSFSKSVPSEPAQPEREYIEFFITRY